MKGRTGVFRKTILKKKNHFWPSLLHEVKKFVNTCKTCKKYKYDRNPLKKIMDVSQIPNSPGDLVHINIFQVFKQNFLSAKCRLTKLATMIPIKSKAIEDVKEAITEVILKNRKPRTIILDNEPSFQYASIENLFRNLDLQTFFIPPAHSQSNEQIESLHSTVLEILCCKNEE
jgi:transposase InsO family protein